MITGASCDVKISESYLITFKTSYTRPVNLWGPSSSLTGGSLAQVADKGWEQVENKES